MTADQVIEKDSDQMANSDEANANGHPDETESSDEANANDHADETESSGDTGANGPEPELPQPGGTDDTKKNDASGDGFTRQQEQDSA